MRRIALGLTLLAAFLSAAAAPNPWNEVRNKIRLSVVRLASYTDDEKEMGCTAFAINFEQRLYLTADHCVVGRLSMDEHPAKEIKHDPKNDLAIVYATFGRIPLKAAAEEPIAEEEVAAYGYGLSLAFPMFLVRKVSVPIIQVNGLPAEANTILDGLVVFGMSGGPVVNARGEVVSMVQQGVHDHNISAGRTISLIKDFAGALWSR